MPLYFFPVYYIVIGESAGRNHISGLPGALTCLDIPKKNFFNELSEMVYNGEPTLGSNMI